MLTFYFILFILLTMASILGSPKIISFIAKKYRQISSSRKLIDYNINRELVKINEANLFDQASFLRTRIKTLYSSTHKNLELNSTEVKTEDILQYCIFKIKAKYVFKLSTSDTELGNIINLEERIPLNIKEVIDIELSNLEELDDSEERILYDLDRTRFTTKFKTIQTDYSEPDKYYQDIKKIASHQYSIVAQRNLYYNSHLFMINKDNILSLKLYLHYLGISSESKTFKFKNITKQNLKILFKDGNQLKKAQSIFEKFKTNKKRDQDETLAQIESLFIKERKKIVLNENEISSAKKKLSDVVDLLNEYLDDDAITEEKKPLLIEESTPISSNKSRFNTIQADFLDQFVSKSYNLPFNEVDAFANSRGIFKSQLIDSINELCYDTLDDMLIEEAEECYEMNKAYYEKISV